MAVKWTEEQQKVIDTRGCNILVSAAAGSGKTAVLVARILKLITDPEKPVDIDRLLVVTFTNAAAAEMRERVRDALEKRAEEEPDNVHLQRQLVLVHNAKITTIHSFCLNVLRSHFQTAGIDPSFRVADEGEVLLLEQESVKETVDEFYEKKDAEFEAFVEQAATGKSDRVLEELVLQLYHFALGQPRPLVWLKECREMYDACAAGSASSWLRYITEETARLLADMHGQIEEALRIAAEPDGPYPYEKALRSDLELLERLSQAKDYESYAEAFRSMGTFARLGSKKDESISEQKKVQVQDIRKSVKDALGTLHQTYYFDRTEVLWEELAQSGLPVRVLTELTEAFMQRLSQKKEERNLLDFGDLEHLALEVLVGADGQPSAASQEYAELFEEIMIDEYQDSNLVQELILASVSGRGRREENRFMVGDVKQSIYRFRLARPELFMEKYRTYQTEEAEQTNKTKTCRIDLHKNFRSRPQVLEDVNYIFRQIMTENLGGIAYDKNASLYAGAVFEPLQETAEQDANSGDAFDMQAFSHRTELHLLESESDQKIRAEAETAARRIRELVGSAPVWDKEAGAYRPAQYRDIVILLRTVSGWAETFAEVLSDQGIPCFTGSQKGYFSAAEVRVVLSYLQILDNPVQDIPLAAVLRSAIGKFSDEELAEIRVCSDARHFYDCCMEYRRNGDDEILRGRLEAFFTLFEKLRAKCGHTPVHLLLWEILDETGYGEYAASLPAGRQRKANLDMLVEKAIAYEATSYRGLYHFVRYIENLKKYEVDYGEANTGSEAENTVRIMSIHKSKGLEFPVVFVCGLGKQFNESDIRSRVVLHPDFGIGCDYVDTKLRTRRATLLKRAIQQRTSSENLGEELRVLYVAMTRAKEKLILTGSVSDLESKLAKWSTVARTKTQELSYSCLSSARTYLDWIVPSLLRHPAGAEFLAEHGLEPVSTGNNPMEVPDVQNEQNPGDLAEFSIRIADTAEEALQEQLETDRASVQLQELLELNTEICRDEEAHAYLENVFAAVYPHEADREIVGKLSVSELKKLSYPSEEEDSEELYEQETVVPLLPSFRGEAEAVSGAARGTVYHTFMENLDFSKEDALEMQLEELISCGKMSDEEAKSLKLADIRKFLRSGIGKRMAQSAENGGLYRERPFVLGVPANQIRPEWNPQETVLVQGIIDAYFVEEDGTIALLDYKTDRVSNLQVLADKYRAQLDYYALALERLTGRSVKTKAIYSFCFGKEILL